MFVAGRICVLVLLTIMLSFLTDYPYVCVALAFVLGAIIGSFLNVCIYRIPLQKSILWPGSRCGSCLQAIPWYDNLPLISYWRLRGKCRACGATFSSRYFWVELLTALSFAGLYWAEVVLNIRGIAAQAFQAPRGVTTGAMVLIWAYHALFLSYLIVVTFIDIDYQEIPLRITIPGAILGIVGGTLGPWPWPVDPRGVAPPTTQFEFGGLGIPSSLIWPLPAGMQPWPVWMPAPDWLAPGTWQMGLATSLVGALVGAGLIRVIRSVFSWGLGKEAMGLGDADLMMLIGAFLGWQDLFLVMAFAVIIGLFYGVFLLVSNRGSELPFGPFLSMGALITLLASYWLHPVTQKLFFDLGLLIALGLVFLVLAFFLTLTIRMMRLIFEA